MSEEIKFITNEEIDEKGVCSAPTVLTGTPEENKKIFDRLCREVVIPRINSLIEEALRIKNVLEGTDALSKENREKIDKIIADLGDIASIELSGDTVSEKLQAVRNEIFDLSKTFMNKIGTWENLKFFATNVVNSLNYLYEMISPSSISTVSSLPVASKQHLMKLFKTFDPDEKRFKFYICTAEYPQDTGFNKGDVCEKIYFEPDITHEMFLSFRDGNIDKFSEKKNQKQHMNIMELVDGEGNEVFLRIVYSTNLDGFLLAFYSNGEYINIWASKNFYLDGKYLSEGFCFGTQSDYCKGMVVKSISDNLSWLLGKDYFEAEYSWKEFGKGGIDDISVEKSGRYSTVTIKNGEIYQTFNIEDGIDGYTPIKGQDYFTASDIEEISTEVEENIKNEVLSAVGQKPDFANDISECTDTSKLYVLPDGFLYAYKKVHLVVSPNVFDLENGAKLNYRLSSSGGETSNNGLAITGYIDVVPRSPYEMRITGVTLEAPLQYYLHITCFDENKTRLGAVLRYPADVTYSNGVYYEDLYEVAFKTYPATKYVRITLGIKEDQSAVTMNDVANLKIEFVPKNKDEIVYQWTNTTHAFVPADYGEVIADISDKTDELAEDIYSIEKELKGMKTDTSTVPSVWEGAVEAVVSKITEKKKLWGINAVSFAFFSDNHTRLGDAGDLISHVIGGCNIPYAFFGGDSISNGEIAKKSYMEEQEQKFRLMVKSIKDGRFCRALGNHDGYYLTPSGERYHLPWEEKYATFLSPDGVYQNKNFGDDGTYYYVDDICTKTRFIVLNSVWFNFKTNADGTVNNTDMAGYGQNQLSWLCNVLKTTDEDYSVVFVSHSPVTNNYHSNQRDAQIAQGIVNAFISGGTYSGEYSAANDTANNVSINVSFDKKGKVIGWFSGHIHRDLILGEDSKSGNKLLFKTVTITSDADMTYDETEAARDMSGDTSHAIDFIVANKKTGEVCIFRLGIGDDRTYNFLEV